MGIVKLHGGFLRKGGKIAAIVQHILQRGACQKIFLLKVFNKLPKFINAVLAKSLMPEVCIAIRKKATASPDKEAFEAALKSMQNIGIKVFD